MDNIDHTHASHRSHERHENRIDPKELDFLHTPPVFLTRIQDAIDHGEDARAIAREIAHDVAFSARILRLANSPLYGNGRIDSIERAVVRIGTNAIRDIVLVAAVASVFNRPPDGVDLDHYWLYCAHCATLARGIAKACGVLHPERLMSAVLLHRIGILALYAADRTHAAEIHAAAHSQQEDVYALLDKERAFFGVTHLEIGRTLAAFWRFPESMQAVIAFHLNPGEADDHFFFDVTIAHLAVLINDTVLRSACDHTDLFSMLPSESVSVIGLSEEALSEIVAEAQSEVFEICASLLGSKGTAARHSGRSK